MNCAEADCVKSGIDRVISKDVAFWWHFLFFPTLFRKTRQKLFFPKHLQVYQLLNPKSNMGYVKFSRAKKALQTLKEK